MSLFLDEKPSISEKQNSVSGSGLTVTRKERLSFTAKNNTCA